MRRSLVPHTQILKIDDARHKHDVDSLMIQWRTICQLQADRMSEMYTAGKLAKIDLDVRKIGWRSKHKQITRPEEWRRHPT